MNNQVISLIKHKLKKRPATYTVVFTHDEEGMYFVVYDIQDTKKDRLAVARDLESAAESLKTSS